MMELASTVLDSKKRRWHITQRPDGSVSIYYTRPDNPAHFVVYDDLDAPTLTERRKVRALQQEMD